MVKLSNDAAVSVIVGVFKRIKVTLNSERASWVILSIRFKVYTLPKIFGAPTIPACTDIVQTPLVPSVKVDKLSDDNDVLAFITGITLTFDKEMEIVNSMRSGAVTVYDETGLVWFEYISFVHPKTVLCIRT
jgi:hypothetical protein